MKKFLWALINFLGCVPSVIPGSAIYDFSLSITTYIRVYIYIYIRIVASWAMPIAHNRAEPIMLKSLPIIFSWISQNFNHHLLFLIILVDFIVSMIIMSTIHMQNCYIGEQDINAESTYTWNIAPFKYSTIMHHFRDYFIIFSYPL